MNKLEEAMIDIAINAGLLHANRDIIIEDSRAFAGKIYSLAVEFEATYNDQQDYIEAIDTFALNKLVELFGGDNDEQL